MKYGLNYSNFRCFLIRLWKFTSILTLLKVLLQMDVEFGQMLFLHPFEIIYFNQFVDMVEYIDFIMSFGLLG